MRRRDKKCARVELQHTACAVDFASNTRRRSKHNRHSMISGEPGQVLTNSDVSRLRIGRKLLKTLSATKFIHRGPRLARHSIIAPEQNLKMCRTRRYSNPVPVCTSDRMHRPRLFFRGRSRCWWRYNPAQNSGETVARTCSKLEAETKRCEWQSWRADQNGQPVPGVIERGGLYDSNGVC